MENEVDEWQFVPSTQYGVKSIIAVNETSCASPPQNGHLIRFMSSLQLEIFVSVWSINQFDGLCYAAQGLFVLFARDV